MLKNKWRIIPGFVLLVLAAGFLSLAFIWADLGNARKISNDLLISRDDLPGGFQQSQKGLDNSNEAALIARYVLYTGEFKEEPLEIKQMVYYYENSAKGHSDFESWTCPGIFIPDWQYGTFWDYSLKNTNDSFKYLSQNALMSDYGNETIYYCLLRNHGHYNIQFFITAQRGEDTRAFIKELLEGYDKRLEIFD